MLNKLHLGKIVLAHIATDVKANGNKLDIKQNTDCILMPDFEKAAIRHRLNDGLCKTKTGILLTMKQDACCVMIL